MDLYILDYNNYYNRIVKKENSIEDYISYLVYGPVTSVFSFTPNDGVNTTQVIGSNDNKYDGSGNYLLAIENNSIHSRWFIIDTKRTRNDQYILTLRRDLLVDFFESIKTSPAFIEKAILTPDNPLIFNDENITVNQIKTSETLLKDKTGCAWIVGYYDYKGLNTPKTVNAGSTYPSYDISIGKSFSDWKDDLFGANSNYIKGHVVENILNISIKNRLLSTDYLLENYTFSTAGESNHTTTYLSFGDISIYPLTCRVNAPTTEELENVVVNSEYDNKNFWNYINDSYGYNNIDKSNELWSLNRKTVRFINSETNDIEYYNIYVNRKRRMDSIYVTTDSVYYAMRDKFETLGLYFDPTFPTSNSESIQLFFNCEYIELDARQITAHKVTATFDKSQIREVEDAPYSIFALPYPEDSVVINGVEISKELSYNLAQNLAVELGDFLWDLQLVPYCPVLEYTVEDNVITFPTDGLDQIAGIATKVYGVNSEGEATEDIKGYILHAVKSSFSLDVEHIIDYSDVKMRSQCDIWRLVSPNFNGQFEFNAMKNGGVTRFNIDCTYIPVKPYIHVNPDFSLLYGSDFDDSRGLICGGNFSLPIIKDAWISYTTQNKNYQNTFDRQISNMETQHKYQRIQEEVSAIAGSIGGVAQGATQGALIAGAPGAIAGGIVGGVSNIIGGIADIAINEALRTEAIDYSKDLFGYQLDNIKAMPNSLVQVTAYTNNNKIFPMLEYYTCTEEEKKAVAYKIAYNSMNVMRIGTISEFIDNNWSYKDIKDKGYIKAKLIRLINNEDFHIVNSISEELFKGAYFK